MEKSLTFYTNPQSRGRIVRWMLEEVGADYETQILGYGGQMKSQEYLAINPMGKVPAIQHGERTVTECAAICAYLADALPAAELAPRPRERGAYYRWLFFAAGPLEAAITNRSLEVVVPPEKQRSVGYGSFEAVIDTLAGALADHRYIASDRFTTADVYVGSQIGFGLQFGTIESRGEFEDYWARLSDRPAYRRARELDDALIDDHKDG